MDSPLLWTVIGFAAGVAAGIALQAARTASRIAEAREETDSAARRRKAEEQTALMGTVATGLAHELRNPLGALRMNLQLLKEQWDNPITERERQGTRKIEVLLRETERLQQVLDSFLRFAAGHKLRREPVDLGRLVEELAAFFEPKAKQSNIEIVREISAGMPDVSLDPGLIRQALMNLVLNAGQAMPGGGTLTLRAQSNGTRSRLQIEDTGRGIDSEVRPRIFELYFSTKPAGTGLGLSITRKIIEEHDGTIDIHSEPGKGTRVTIELPHE